VWHLLLRNLFECGLRLHIQAKKMHKVKVQLWPKGINERLSDKGAHRRIDDHGGCSALAHGGEKEGGYGTRQWEWEIL
jgi:hypothetical protein